MQVHRNIEQLPRFEKAVVTIGTFDGVHLGHQKIIAQLISEARRINGETVIISFHPHPRKVIGATEKTIHLINTVDERIELLATKGIDHFVIVPFTRAFSDLSPENYIEDFLIDRFHPAVVIIGYDHRFGKDRTGDYKLLEKYSSRGFFELQEISEKLINDSIVSSTLVRNAILRGDATEANAHLGYPFFLEGIVVTGDQRGRTIGFPTANLQVTNPEKIIPANGVYTVKAEIKEMPGHQWGGMMNIGIRPTFDGQGKTIEVHLFDFSQDIYGHTLRVIILRFLRAERKFTDVGELKEQLHLDRLSALHELGN